MANEIFADFPDVLTAEQLASALQISKSGAYLLALFHLNVTQIKRSKGQSAIAAAAYRPEKNYTANTTARPPTTQRSVDRQTLWNAVEKAERGKNAQLAYSFDIALAK